MPRVEVGLSHCIQQLLLFPRQQTAPNAKHATGIDEAKLTSDIARYVAIEIIAGMPRAGPGNLDGAVGGVSA